MVTDSRKVINEKSVSLRALVESDDPKALGELEKLAQNKDANPNLRREAIYMLGRYFPDSISQLLPLLDVDDEAPDIRAAILGAVGDNKIMEAIDVVSKSAEDRAVPFRTRSIAISVLAQLNAELGKPLILKTIADKTESVRLRRSLIFDVYPEVDLKARELLLQIVNDRDEEADFRAAAVERLAAVPSIDHELFLNIILDTDEQYYVRHTALRYLSRRDDDTIVDTLIEQAQKDGIPGHIRSDIVAALAGHSHRPNVRAMAIDAIVNDPGSDAARHFRIQADTDWKKVIGEFNKTLELSGKRRNEIDAAGIVRSLYGATRDSDDIFGVSKISPEELQKSWIEAALNADERMTGILGKLIVETAEGDQAAAGASINAYQSKHDTAPEKLRKLRIAVGGETALDPIMQTLSENLEDRFHKPIKEINEQTRQMWDQTTKHAQMGFQVRIWMSVIVFVVGIILLIISSFQFLFGDITGATLWGPGVSFVAGLAMTLLVVYSGPLKEIRQSVNDLGIANASFIAYVHRVLEISHTFSFYYLQQKITFEEMEKSSKLIREAMFDTIKSFQIEAIDSTEDAFARVLDRGQSDNSATTPDGTENKKEVK